MSGRALRGKSRAMVSPLVINITIYRSGRKRRERVVYKGLRLTFIKIPEPLEKYVKSGRRSGSGWEKSEGRPGSISAEKCY